MRIALGIEYDGGAFSGWQRQRNRRTVQEIVERTLSRVADERITVACAGRTDAGVHAFEQVVHFDTRARREPRAWVRGGNAGLPDDVRIIWAREVSGGFHARFAAIARFYRYVVLNRSVASALSRQRAAWSFSYLDTERMQHGADHLIGEHDFTSFRGRDCHAKSPFRFLHVVRVSREGDRVVFDIVGNAFLHHMVRNIVGVLMEIGAGRRDPAWAKEVLEARDRRAAAATAPAHGLFLVGVYYASAFALPTHPMFNRLPADVRRFGEPEGA